MTERSYDVMSREAVKQRLDHSDPDNRDPAKGYALVNVLSQDDFDKEHIPDSINIPAGHEEEFERRFAKEKEIIVYCDSTKCDASPKVAKRLADAGFTAIRDYEAGMRAWKDAGYRIESSRAA